MKALFSYTSLLFAILCSLSISCEKPNNEGENNSNGGSGKGSLDVICQTVDATEINHTSAKLSATSTIINAKESYGKVCFYYSFSDSEIASLKNSTRIDAGSIPSTGGSFSVTLYGLNPSMKYYYIASVTIDGKDFFSDVKSFSTKEQPRDPAITGAADNLTEKSVSLQGSVNPTSDMQDVLMGVLYSLNSSPNIENSKKVKADNANNNSFTIELDNLSSTTTYYYKTYIQYNGEQYRFGEIKSFTTKEVSATVSTTKASNITEFKGILNGRLEVKSKATLSKEVWFLYSKTATTIESLKENGTRLPSSLSDDNVFQSSLSDLECGTKYYYVAVAQVYDRCFYGDVVSFETESIKATVVTSPASMVTEFTAQLNGQLSIDSQETMSKSVCFYYSKSVQSVEELKATGTKILASLSGDGTFYADVSGLEYNTQYYCIAAAKVHNKEFYGEPISFVTLDISADISTEQVTDIMYYNAMFKGKLSNVSIAGASITVGFKYSDKESTLEGLLNRGIAATAYLEGDAFKSLISSLKADTKYYCVAIATVAGKPFYGSIVSFETRPLAIDLGLSVLWAAINVGASYRCDPGEPFSWGETSIKSKYLWSTYKWGRSATSLTKYNTLAANGTVDNLTQLEPNDDAASVNMGEGWKMPTSEEWTELLTKCNWTWEWLAEDGYGIYGYTIVGPNGNSIFIPVAGGCNGDYKKTNYNTGCYWSSTLDQEHPENSRGVLFYNTQHYPETINRFVGYAVRAVHSK